MRSAREYRDRRKNSVLKGRKKNMEQRSLRVLEADKTFFTKITTTISKLLIPTKVGINGLLISMKRNNLLKAYETYTISENGEDVEKREQDARRYEESYSLYLESIDKYIMDSVYKKVKSGTASGFEADALSKYYTIVHLKENEYIEYKHRKQKYLIELDYETIITLGKDKLTVKYIPFYLSKIDALYKGILKNYSIQLADVNRAKFSSNDEIYEKIFATLDEYSVNVLPIKLQNDKEGEHNDVVAEYEKIERFEVGKLDELDFIEKKIILIGISRSLFTHSLPLIAAEQCYKKLLKQTRAWLVNDKKQEPKKKQAYNLLIHLMEEYNVKLLSTKVYWDKPELREEYKIFWDKYKNINENKELSEKETQKLKESLFLKYDLKKLYASKNDYSKIIAFYKTKLVEFGAMREIQNACKSLEGKFIKQK